MIFTHILQSSKIQKFIKESRQQQQQKEVHTKPQYRGSWTRKKSNNTKSAITQHNQQKVDGWMSGSRTTQKHQKSNQDFILPNSFYTALLCALFFSCVCVCFLFSSVCIYVRQFTIKLNISFELVSVKSFSVIISVPMWTILDKIYTPGLIKATQSPYCCPSKQICSA